MEIIYRIMNKLKLIKHAKGAPGLRLFGLGPSFFPCNGLKKLEILMKNNSFWAKQRNKNKLRKMLIHSSIIVSAWDKNNIVGFGRATSDYIFRAVLWDIIVDTNYQRKGIGSIIINNLINDSSVREVEKIYLMTTKSKDFYNYSGFQEVKKQSLFLYNNNKNI